MRKILEKCPSCDGKLYVTKLACTQCDTEITGSYQPCTFCGLPADDLRFLEIFVMCRGNVKEMERESGMSYWAIRNQLGEILQQLGYEVDPEEEEKIQTQKHGILKALEHGEITVAEAEDMLTDLRTSGSKS